MSQKQKLIEIQKSASKVKLKYLHEKYEEEYLNNFVLPEIEARKKTLQDIKVDGSRFKLETVL